MKRKMTIIMKTSENAAETFEKFLLTKRAGGAKTKTIQGYSSKKYFWIPFWFGIAGYLLVIALPDRGLVRKVKPKNDELPDL